MLDKKKYQRKRTKKSPKALFLYLLIVAVLSGLAYGYRTLNTHLQERLSQFELSDIQISGNEILSKSQVLAMLGLKQGEKLLKISVNDVVKKLKESQYIRAVTASYSLPSTLRINIHERQAVAFLYGRGLNMIDAEAFILPVPEINKRWDLPVITGINENLGIQGAETTSESAKLGVEIARYVAIMEMPLKAMVSEINFSHKDYVSVYITGSSAEIRVDSKNYQDQLFIASRYLKDYQDYNKIDDLEYVDVRFNGQIIIKENKA
ncbi:MAG: FtsQ-type POTRA domain-containing protein [Calditrichaeota bacterium]|nr:FtsQ-type POTRA domain-containing protein [Calditrichota bacterium]